MADEKLIFPIGFDLEEGVKKAGKDWKNHYRKRLQDAIDSRPLKVKIDFESKGIDTKEFKRWMVLAREAERLERERIKNAKEWQKVADQQAMAETRRANATNESNARIERQNRKAEASERRKRDAVERTNEAYKRQGGYLSRLFQRMVAYASVAQAFSFVRNVRDVTAEFELQRVALGSIIGDLNEANAMFEQIKAAAVKSPFQIKELVTYTKQLAAYKIESDELFETTQRLANISAGLGVGMERLVLAYGQIRATGYLRASEVRQLTEAGIPIVEELAKKMSDLRGETVSAAEVMGLISERAISFGMVKEVFDDMTSAGGMFYKMQEKQAETLAGQWSNLQDAISIMYDEIGNTESVNNAMKGMIGLIKSLAENWRVVSDVAMWSVGAALGYAKVVKPISELVKKMVLLNKAERAYKLAAHWRSVGEPEWARQQEVLARAYRRSATALKGFGGALKSIGSFIKANWVGMLITAITAVVSWLISARQEANRLNKELDKIGSEGAMQADQSVRNFERLAKAIRESADGSEKQTEALEEMKRAYGEFLPSQDKSIINLVREKDGYNAITQAIREKIALQIQEQKLNTIASEYGSQFTKWEGKLKESPFFKDFSKEEISLIIADIKNAVNEGLIASTNDIEDNMMKVRDIVRNITGSTLSQNALYRLFEGGTLYKGYITELIKVQESYNEQIQDVENSVESATGSLGKYTQAYKDFKEELKDVTGTGEKFSFEWNESKTKNEIKAYNEFIGDLLAKEGIKFDIGEAIDFKGLYEALGDNYPQLKQVIAKIQKEYEKLIPTDITRLANDKLQEYADKVGISMDDVKEHLKTNEQSTEDWAKGLKGAYESLEKKLAEYKKSQEAFSKQGAPFRDWSEDIEETTKEMEVLKLLMDFFKEFLSQSGGGTKTNPRIAQLKDELSTVEKIYKEYQELSKYGEEYANKTIAQMFQGVDLKYLQMATSPDKMRKALEDALRMAKLEGDKELALEIQYKLGKFDADEEQRKLEKSLKDLSDKISRTKTAKEFFDRMLGMTGDKQLSASLTVSIYGGEMGDDLGERLAKDVATKFQEQVQKYFGDIDISSAINKATGEIDPIKLEKLLTEENIEKIGKDNVIEIRKIINDLIKANAEYATELFKSYEKFFDYEKRMTMVTQREEEERKKIRESMIPDDQKVQLEEASKKREQEQISAIEIEQLKDTADWEKTFEDLNNLGSLTVKNLISLLEDYIAKKKEAGEPIAESDMKTLMNELNQLRERDAQLDPFATIKASLKDLTDATKEYNKAKKDGDEEGMADAQNKRAKALNKLETAVNAVASGFQNLSNLLTEFQELLGIEDDSAMGEVFNGAAKALGFVATALSTAIALTLLWNSTLWANPLFAGVAIVSGVLGAIAGVFSAIANAKVNKANKEIERQQELLDNLSYSYDRLQKSAERAFGTEYIQNYQRQLDNLEAQVEAYEKQLDLERSKGKKADEEKIKEYDNQIRDTKDAIEDMYGSLSGHFLGTDLTSAARDFASAWIEAYKEFANTTDAMKAKFQEMIQNMIVESLIAKVMERALKPVFDMVDDMGDSDFYSNSFWSQLMTEMNKATENGVVGAQNIMGMLESIGINLRDTGTGLTGISRDIATASEESILGLAAGINTQNFYISQVPTKLDTIIGLLRGGSAVVDSGVNVQDLITIQNQFLSHLPTIAQNTAETVARCERAAVACESMASKLGSVIKPKGTTSTHSVNVTIGS